MDSDSADNYGTCMTSLDDAPAPAYPVRLDGELDPNLSRWMWLVKWILAIPHFIILVFLGIAVWFVTVFAFFAILFTGRYPRSLFDFTLGFGRWVWRVSYYCYSPLGTDRYPPFSLGEEPDYPARLDVDYPEQLSRGLVLVKWWLLAIPHYAVVAILAGGGWSGANEWSDGSGSTHWSTTGTSGGLIALLAFIAAVILLFRNRYPVDLFRLLMGFERWVYRVAAYALLLRDEYPPFRLDMGGRDPGTAPAPAALGDLDEPDAGGRLVIS